MLGKDASFFANMGVDTYCAKPTVRRSFLWIDSSTLASGLSGDFRLYLFEILLNINIVVRAKIFMTNGMTLLSIIADHG